MAYITLPAQERTKSGFEAFSEAFTPGLERAFQLALQRKMEEEQYRKNIERARQLAPQLFTETTPISEYRRYLPKGTELNFAGGLTPERQIEVARQLTQAKGIKIPEKIRRFAFKTQGLQPSVDTATGSVSLKPEDAFQAYYKSLIPKTDTSKPQGDMIYRTSEGIEIPTEQAQSDIEKGNTNFYISKREITKSGVKENVISKPEDLEKSRAIKDKSNFVLSQAQDALDTISEVEQGIQHFGLWGQLPSIPGTPRVNWEANVNKLLSGKVIDVMTKMKEASKTGATGFGQLSEKELAVLQQASTALKRGLSQEDAQRYLDAMKASLQKVVAGSQIQKAMPQSSIDPLEGKAAVNPKTGQKIIRRGGQWLPMQ